MVGRGTCSSYFFLNSRKRANHLGISDFFEEGGGRWTRAIDSFWLYDFWIWTFGTLDVGTWVTNPYMWLTRVHSSPHPILSPTLTLSILEEEGGGEINTGQFDFGTGTFWDFGFHLYLTLKFIYALPLNSWYARPLNSYMTDHWIHISPTFDFIDALPLNSYMPDHWFHICLTLDFLYARPLI